MSEVAGGAEPVSAVEELDSEYEVIGELGRGGMAIVYRARERELDRQVAIKVVRASETADDEAVARLAREARTIAHLQHPNIVTLYSAKRLRGNRLALIMQLVPGRTLRDELDAGALPIDRAEQILRDIADALAHAHAHGIVHRDVKPENIFIDETTGRALLSDFGVARSLHADNNLTVPGMAIGTPTYMSPEQIDGREIDGRSDLYSLGLVGWEMLAGERPWDGESLYNVIFRQKHEELPALDELRPGIPDRIHYFVDGLLRKRPESRWESAERFLQRLASADEPPGVRQWKEARRRRRRDKSSSGARAIVSAESLALATTPFRRPAAGEVQHEPESTSMALVPVDAPSVDADWTDDRPTRGTVPRRAGALMVAALVLVVAGGATALTIATRDTAPEPQIIELSDSFDDVAAIQLPISIAAPLDTSATSDSSSVAASSRIADSARAEVVRLAETRLRAERAAADSLARRRAESPPSRVVADSARRTKAATRSPVPASTVVTSATPPSPSPTPPPRATRAEPAPVRARVTALSFPNEYGTIAPGGRHSCMLGDEGVALCWGANERGQLGDGGNEGRTAAAPVAGDFQFVRLTAGASHSCGVTRGGDTFCWGANDRGQLGDATTSSRSAPVRVAGSGNVRMVGAGLAHTCGVSRATVLCWGDNQFGQIGDGGTETRRNPVAITLGGATVVTVAVGANHSCALTNDGSAYCWGQNSSGQLGDGSTVDRNRPVRIGGELRFVSIAAGQAHSCAVTPEGDAFCWGRNSYGQLGTAGGDAVTPRRVDGGPFSTIATGAVHSCARTRDGRVMCWGRNSYGQLGDATTSDRARPVPVVGAPTLVTLRAAGAHTCGATASGDGYCWGYNVEGQLGDGSRTHGLRPVRVVLPPR